MSEIEARLARRLAIAFWKGERAERIEVALFDAAPKTRMNGYRSEEADPLTTFDLKRFNAVRGYQAQQGREISRCLKELRQLRKEALAECTGEPEAALENEPGSPQPPANDDASTARAAGRAGRATMLAKRTQRARPHCRRTSGSSASRAATGTRGDAAGRGGACIPGGPGGGDPRGDRGPDRRRGAGHRASGGTDPPLVPGAAERGCDPARCRMSTRRWLDLARRLGWCSQTV